MLLMLQTAAAECLKQWQGIFAQAAAVVLVDSIEQQSCLCSGAIMTPNGVDFSFAFLSRHVADATQAVQRQFEQVRT